MKRRRAARAQLRFPGPIPDPASGEKSRTGVVCRESKRSGIA
ncbi:MAG: hypothetical protein V2I54_12415 [Bacteroidales bacterium]|nr:hypothetical protein [Bacteroidales bacterium]